jgi:hypothetical protein
MTKVRARTVALTALLVALTALPTAAQSPWDNEAPIVLAVAQGGFLITVAPPTFKGCTTGFTWYALQGMPNLELWTWLVNLDLGAPLFPYHMVENPLGTLNFSWAFDGWMRVFPVSKADIATFLAQPCEFYGTRPFVAEGIARMTYHSADDALTGPGVNSWGWTIQGDLDDHGYCSSGSPRLFWLQKYVVRSQTDILTAKSTASKGPTLTCK